MNITQFTMEEVRCFGERQTLEIRPLTFLVGENSTGKTTALACFHVLADYLRGRGMDFNSHPYSMGTFRDIVRNSKKKEKKFQLGFTYKHNNENIQTTVELVEKNKGLEPTVNWVAIKLADGEIVIQVEDATKKETRLGSFDEKQNQYKIICGVDVLNEPNFSFFFDPYFFTNESKGEISFLKYLDRTSDKFEESIYRPWDVFKTLLPLSTSPVRSRPKRTYDPTREFNDPEGSDVPTYLMRIEATEKKGLGGIKNTISRVWQKIWAVREHRRKKPWTFFGSSIPTAGQSPRA